MKNIPRVVHIPDKRCPRCGTQMPWWKIFCPNCGWKFREEL